MATLLVLVGTMSALALLTLLRPKVRHAVAADSRQALHLVPHALTMLVMVAHASEITRVVEDVSLVHIVIATILFGVWVLTKSGPEEI